MFKRKRKAIHKEKLKSKEEKTPKIKKMKL